MFEAGWEETVAASTVKEQLGGVGCLLQIHPLELSNNLTELSDDRTTIGRDASCVLMIADSSVSRKHAVIERHGDVYRITDLGSTNGTCVNEERVTSCELVPGDRVQFGGFIYKFLSTNHIEMQYHEAVYSMMTRDGLTGTLNKRSFLDIIEREFRRAAHRSTPLSLVLFDIDHFKSVNDTYGHLAGDEVLQEVSRRIDQVVASHDVFARYGGEEFAVLLADVTTQEAADVAERCRRVIEEMPFDTSVQPLPITVSLGVADMTNVEPDSDASALVQAADEKLYEAKRGGRNRVCC